MSNVTDRPDAPSLAYCETVTAGPTARWHIRNVGAEGLKPNGGLKLPALCGRDLAGGWDIPGVEPTLEHAARLGAGVCGPCAKALGVPEGR